MCVVERLLKLFVATDKGDVTLICDEGIIIMMIYWEPLTFV